MKKSVLVFVLMLFLIAVNYFLFYRLFDVNYFIWYLNDAPFISISLAFIGIIWNDLDRNLGLISADPSKFLSGCLLLLAVVFTSLGVNLKNATSPNKNATQITALLSLLWDSVISILVYLILLVLLFLWFFVVAPLVYFVHLVVGAPSRVGLYNPELGTRFRSESNTTHIEIVRIEKVNDMDSLNVSFSRKPVSITAAIAAILFWIVKFFLEYFEINLTV
jgi:hypothetical protein